MAIMGKPFTKEIH
ncbi:hypothetical protein RDI58_034148 [Solanum bulbocastanum]|uniref:Uncharacterized protein n=1 Tax=Solanum bulbocastanum TaxID=147425 RepID=A0AAN8XT24_SOLBU